ncbi:MAG TPA: hypothetical protein VJP80_00210 [Candidatus Saccharimonadales bacterium]|nr:hypothetical protein [Candidatus Saccharimonadales bacterium]
MTSKPTDVRPVLRVGDLAYYDGLYGIRPCKVMAITGNTGAPSSDQCVTIRFTATCSGWRRGDEMRCFGFRVIPRAAYFKRRYGARIGYYTVEVPS